MPSKMKHLRRKLHIGSKNPPPHHHHAPPPPPPPPEEPSSSAASNISDDPPPPWCDGGSEGERRCPVTFNFLPRHHNLSTASSSSPPRHHPPTTRVYNIAYEGDSYIITTNITKMAGEAIDMSNADSPACLVFTTWNNEPTAFSYEFRPTVISEFHSNKLKITNCTKMNPNAVPAIHKH